MSLRRTQIKRGTSQMKRSGFKRKPHSAISGVKVKGLNKLSKTPISTLKRKIWEYCKQITRKRYGNICYTCGATGLEKFNWQTGHVPYPKSILPAKMKLDLRVLRPQCMSCNQFHGGMGAEAYKRMLQGIGQDEMDKIEKDRQKIEPVRIQYYRDLLEEYKQIIVEL